MSYIVDLHVHTSFGSLDSGITDRYLLEAAARAGLAGLAITEHTRAWPQERLEELSRDSSLLLVSGREFATEWGHLVVLGLDHHLPTVTSVPELRRTVLAAGGFMILAHPFRYFPGSANFLFGRVRDAAALPPEELARHPVFQHVDEVEVFNFGCTARENETAQAVARLLGLRGVAGSDAHAVAEVGRCVTILQRPVASEGELIAELRAGRYRAAQRAADGQLLPWAAAP